MDENGPFLDGLPMTNGDFRWIFLCFQEVHLHGLRLFPGPHEGVVPSRPNLHGQSRCTPGVGENVARNGGSLMGVEVRSQNWMMRKF